MPRPRILLVPHLSELDWRIKPLREVSTIARYWGPGRFHTALREAVESGRARRVSAQPLRPARLALPP